MVEKDICQNPKCCEGRTKDSWNINLYGYSDKLLEYFCTTGCAFQWLRDNLSNIIERQHAPKKIIERIILQSENN